MQRLMAIQIVSPTLPKTKLQEILEKRKPLVTGGHFLYPADDRGPSSHLSSFFYLARLTSSPEFVSLLVADLTEWIKRNRVPVDVVFAPADPVLVPIIVQLLESLRKPAAFLEYLPSGRFGSNIESAKLLQLGEKVFVFNGVSTTGRCVGETLPAYVEKAGGVVSAIGAFVKGTAPGVSATETKYGDRFYSALQADIPMYSPDRCPLCKEGLPLVPWNASVSKGAI